MLLFSQNVTVEALERAPLSRACRAADAGREAMRAALDAGGAELIRARLADAD